MTRHLRFDRLPALPLLYARGAISRKRRPGASFEPRVTPLDAEISGLTVDADLVQRFRAVCDHARGDGVPLPLPLVMATPLHAALLLEPSFPYPVAGIVHVRQTMRRHAPLAIGERLSIHCRVGDEREARRGVELDLVTEVRVAGDLRWDSVSTALVPGRGTPPPRVGAANLPPLLANEESWDVPANMGRQFARVTGDYNPIHLWPATARPFGFRRPIVHGMWSLGRCLAHLEGELPPDPVQVDVAFRRPIALPARVRLCWEAREGQLIFAVRTADGHKDHLRGSAAPPTDD